jgi:hypothetical protein
MATGLIAAVANAVLAGTANLSTYVWFKLHTGDPGAAGTTAPATETTRKQITWGTPAAGAQASVTTDLVWTSIAGSEDATHCSIWDASTAGNCGMTGTVTANPYTAGDTLTIPAGSVTRSFTVAS